MLNLSYRQDAILVRSSSMVQIISKDFGIKLALRLFYNPQHFLPTNTCSNKQAVNSKYRREYSNGDFGQV